MRKASRVIIIVWGFSYLISFLLTLFLNLNESFKKLISSHVILSRCLFSGFWWILPVVSLSNIRLDESPYSFIRAHLWPLRCCSSVILVDCDYSIAIEIYWIERGQHHLFINITFRVGGGSHILHKERKHSFCAIRRHIRRLFDLIFLYSNLFDFGLWVDGLEISAKNNLTLTFSKRYDGE